MQTNLNDISTLAPIFAIAISGVTLFVTLGKWLVNKYNESLNNRINLLMEDCFGNQIEKMGQKYTRLWDRVNTLYNIVLKTDINDKADNGNMEGH